MNKLFLIVLLAACLLSAHAFVKRDAPADAAKTDNSFDNIQKQLQDISNNFGSKVKEAFDPDTLKHNFNEFVDKMNKAFEDLKPKQQ